MSSMNSSNPNKSKLRLFDTAVFGGIALLVGIFLQTVVFYGQSDGMCIFSVCLNLRNFGSGQITVVSVKILGFAFIVRFAIPAVCRMSVFLMEYVLSKIRIVVFSVSYRNSVLCVFYRGCRGRVITVVFFCFVDLFQPAGFIVCLSFAIEGRDYFGDFLR